jgi:hypothetical protein
MRDLDDLLDPVVSRRATEAARRPDFATVERRGRRRRQRARAVAVGAVVAAVATVSIVGTRVAQDQAAPEPAGRIGFEGPNGELARAIATGDADPYAETPSRDGSVLLTGWTVLDVEAFDPNDEDSLVPRGGFTLRVDGETYWSKVYNDVITGLTVIGDDGYVVLHGRKADLVDPDGIQPLTFRKSPVDIADPEIDAIVPMLVKQGRHFGLDRESATVAPVAELDGVGPTCSGSGHGVVRTEAGEIWALDAGAAAPSVVRYGADGSTSYPYAGGLRVRGASLVEHGGQVGVVWVTPEGDVRVSVPGDTSEAVAGYDYPDVGGACSFGAAVLPDGRLLLLGPDQVARSVDSTWAEAEAFPQAHERAFAATGNEESVCFGGANDAGQPPMNERPDLMCTTDGLHWQRTEIGS